MGPLPNLLDRPRPGVTKISGSEGDRAAWLLWLPGRWPTYTDIHERGNHFTTRRLKLKWQGDVQLFLQAGGVPHLGSVSLRYTHYRADRRCDKSNLASGAMKIVEDALVKAKVIRDDRWRFIVDFDHTFTVDKAEGLKVVIIDRGNPV